MKRKASFIIVFLLAIFFSTIFFSTKVVLADSTSGYAWSENTGYIDFSQAIVSNSVLSGYAYSSNIGWISFNCSNTSSCGTTDYKVSNSSGTLSGYAWSENTGYIDFSQVTINTSTGIFSGYAYSPNIGWISMNCSNTSSCDTVDYKVTTAWRVTHSSSGGYYKPPTTVPVIIPPTVSPLAIPTPIILIKTLRFKMIGEDVRSLQKYLNTHGYIVATTGAGSPSNETTYFGLKTKASVIKFQQANHLTPDGIVGLITRALLK